MAASPQADNLKPIPSAFSPKKSQREQLIQEAAHYPFWTLQDRQICDIELLRDDSFAPLPNFMGRADYESVLDTMRLKNGVLFPIPITLDVSEEFIAPKEIGDKITLRDKEGFAIAILTLTEIWKPDLAREASLVYGTLDTKHPAVDYLFHTSKPVYIAGHLQGIAGIQHYDYPGYRHTPQELRTEFKRRGWKKIVAFQTRNPMHMAHISMTKKAIRDYDAKLLLHPVAGMTKPGDINHYTRVRCYEHALSCYSEGEAMLSLLPLAMRMGGPREALLHGIIRRNHGCTHMIIGRDHAGPGKDKDGKPFYGEFEAQRALLEHASEIGIEPIAFGHIVYQPEKKKYVFANEVQPGEKTLSISGTKLRSMLERGDRIPEWFTLPQIARELHRILPPLPQRGFTVFFTGLSGSGKSTIAHALIAKLQEHNHGHITLLDGDIVRTHLSSELGFSPEHRSINVCRIGYVASEITKNHGIAICAPIAPYEKDRQFNRRLISQYGGYIEVYISTPLEICEKRDTKGLYIRARENLMKNFTGIGDAYEAPENADIVIDTRFVRINDAADKICAKIQEHGYLKTDD